MVKFNKEKTKKFFKTVGKGATVVGRKVGAGAKVVATKVRTGTGQLIEKAKEASTPEAQEARLVAQEKKLIVQERLANRRARIAKLQKRGGGIGGGIGGSFLGGSGGSGGGMNFKPLDMGSVLNGGEKPRKRKGKPFDPFSQF